MAGRPQAFRGNSQNRVDNVRFIAIEDLDCVPVRLGVVELQYILAWFENGVSNLNGLIHGENRFLVPHGGLRRAYGYPRRDPYAADYS
jgi:hypothetical protein